VSGMTPEDEAFLQSVIRESLADLPTEILQLTGLEPRPTVLLEALGSLDRSDPHQRPPTGPGTPSAQGVRTPRQKNSGREVIKLTSDRRRRKSSAVSAEQRVRATWRPGVTISQLEREASVSRSTAHKWNPRTDRRTE
jgi:hypothetical protein